MIERILMPLFLAIYLIGCSNASDTEYEYMIPYYESCSPHIERFKKITRERYNIYIETKRFSPNREYSAHPGFIGVILLTGNNTDDNFQVIQNSIQQLCFPIHSIKSSNDDIGRKIVLDEIRFRSKDATKEKYLVVSDEEFTVYFNNTSQEMKENILR